ATGPSVPACAPPERETVPFPLFVEAVRAGCVAGGPTDVRRETSSGYRGPRERSGEPDRQGFERLVGGRRPPARWITRRWVRTSAARPRRGQWLRRNGAAGDVCVPRTRRGHYAEVRDGPASESGEPQTGTGGRERARTGSR